jgi:hypothetical protein
MSSTTAADQCETGRIINAAVATSILKQAFLETILAAIDIVKVIGENSTLHSAYNRLAVKSAGPMGASSCQIRQALQDIL